MVDTPSPPPPQNQDPWGWLDRGKGGRNPGGQHPGEREGRGAVSYRPEPGLESADLTWGVLTARGREGPDHRVLWAKKVKPVGPFWTDLLTLFMLAHLLQVKCAPETTGWQGGWAGDIEKSEGQCRNHGRHGGKWGMFKRRPSCHRTSREAQWQTDLPLCSEGWAGSLCISWVTSHLAWALRRLWDNRPDGYLLCVVPRQPTDQPGLAPRRPQAPGGQAEAAGLGDDQVRSLSLVPASSWTQQVTASLTQEWRNRLLFLMRRGGHISGGRCRAGPERDMRGSVFAVNVCLKLGEEEGDKEKWCCGGVCRQAGNFGA